MPLSPPLTESFMANPSPSLPATADVQRTTPDIPELQNHIHMTTPDIIGGRAESAVINTHSGTPAQPSGQTSTPHHGYRRYSERYTIAERDKSAQEYFLRRRLTSLSYLDSPLTSTDSPSWSSVPRRYRRLTAAESRKAREYAEEYARFIGPDYWKQPPLDSVQDNADTSMDENTEQRFES